MRLIDADAFCEALEWADADVFEDYADGYSEWGYTRDNIKDIVGRMPTVDPESLRPYGRWIPMHYEGGILDGSNFDKCSVCGYERFFDDEKLKTKFNYCPNCGAIMDGEMRDNGKNESK